MPLTDKQKEYLMQANHRWNVKTGATGSGKSFLDFTTLIPKRIMNLRGEGLAVLLGNTRGTLERNIIDPMREWYPEFVGDIKADNTITLFGKKFYALGADNKKHVDRIRGATIEYAYGDEVTTWSKDVFDMLKSRLRCPHSRFDGTCNPDSPYHWFKAFLDSDGLDIYQQSYTIDDGALSPEIVNALKKEYAGTVLYQRYILGLWAAAEGAIYRPYCDDEKRFLFQHDKTDIVKSTIGVDFGGNGSATAFVCVGILRGYKGVTILREYYKKGIVTPAEQENAFVAFARECNEDFGTVEVRCDSEAQTLIAGFKAAALRNRLYLDIKNSIKGRIMDRISFTTRLMGRGAFFVSPGCKHVREALSSAVYDAKSMEDKRLDNGTTNIDSLDAMEYAFEPDMDKIIQLSCLRR